MFSIYAGDTCIYDDTTPLEGYKLISPRLKKSTNSAGEMEMTVPVTNIGYDLIEAMTTYITVYRNDVEYWEGRVISESTDFLDNRKLTLEGELAFLNDTIQPPNEYTNKTPRQLLDTYLTLHNSKVDDERKFYVGYCQVNEDDTSVYRYTNYDTTLDAIKNTIIDRVGGIIQIRKANGKRYLDIISDRTNVTSQVIRFGENLLDYTRNWDQSQFCTVIIPKGMRLEESSIEPLEEYCTVESVNNGKIYVVNQTMVNNYGWIEKVVNFEDIGFPDKLLEAAKEYLTDLQFSDVELNVTALDLSYLNPSLEDIDVDDKVRVISEPHGMDRIFPVTEIDIPLDDPSATTYTLGDTDVESYTTIVNNNNQQLYSTIGVVESSVRSFVDVVKDNVTALIHRKTNGYITITTNEYGSNELIFSDTQDYTASSACWIWNYNGLGFVTNGWKAYENDQSNLSIAIGMDGTIAGNMIAANSIAANKLSVEYTSSIDNQFNSVTTSLDIYDRAIRGKIAVNDPNLKEYSTITQLLGEITLKVSKADLGSEIQLCPNDVRVAFNNVSEYFSFNTYKIDSTKTAVSLNIKDSSKTYNLMTLNSSGLTLNESSSNKIVEFTDVGMKLYNGSTYVGVIGKSSLAEDTSKKGLMLNARNSASFVGIGWQNKPSLDNYMMKFVYTPSYIPGQSVSIVSGNTSSNGDDLSSNTLHAFVDLDMHRKYIYRARIGSTVRTESGTDYQYSTTTYTSNRICLPYGPVRNSDTGKYEFTSYVECVVVNGLITSITGYSMS